MNETADARLFAALSEIQNATDGEAIEKLLDHLIAFYGLKSAAYLGTGIARAPDAEPYLAVTYSPDWVERYKDQRYAEIDPVIVMGLRRLLPLDWSEFGRLEGKQVTLFGEAGEFGLGRRGLSIPVHGRLGDRGLLSITSDLGESEWECEKRIYMRDFQVLATHIHDRVLRLEGLAPQPARLSPRELECLEWIAQGKTAWECAAILGLSQHTVRCYLESARHKLGAISNTHAVSIAHRAGLLFQAL